MMIMIVMTMSTDSSFQIDNGISVRTMVMISIVYYSHHDDIRANAGKP